MTVGFAVFDKHVLHKKLHFYVNMEKHVFILNRTILLKKSASLGAH